MNNPLASEGRYSSAEERYLFVLATVPVVGLLLHFFGKNNSEMVKHYAKQSIWPLILGLISITFYFTLIGPFISSLFNMIQFVSWLIIAFSAWRGKYYKYPFIGGYLDKLIS